jgi:hypothetical protein
MAKSAVRLHNQLYIVFIVIFTQTLSCAATFTDITESAGVAHIGNGKCVALGDVNNDGFLDIYLNLCYEPNLFFINNKDGTFTERSVTLGIDSRNDGHGAAFADFNNDGLLDLFVANNPEAVSRKRGRDVAEKVGVSGGDPNYSCGVAIGDYDNDGKLDIYVCRGGTKRQKNSLYHQNKDGTFTDMAKVANVAEPGEGYCCAFADIDGDGYLDLFVGNLNIYSRGQTRHLYRNNGNGTFSEITEEAGLAGGSLNTSCAFGDIDNDGDLDLFIGTLVRLNPTEEEKMNRLYRNDGNGKFADITRSAGVGSTNSTRGATFADIDNDGYLDIYVGNSWEKSEVYRNNRDGTFTDITKDSGIDVFYGHGCAFGDLDNDGDLDLYTSNWKRISANNPGNFALYQNNTNDSNYLRIIVKGTKTNRSGIGAKISVYRSGHLGEKEHLVGYREVGAGDGVFTSNPLIQHFGLSSEETYDLRVFFPVSETIVDQRNVAVSQTIVVEEETN